MNNLRNCNISIVDWLCMCKNSGETTDYLLLHYEYVHCLWSMVFCLFGLQWVMPERVVDLLACWIRGFWKTSYCWCLEGHSTMCPMEHLERKKPAHLWKGWPFSFRTETIFTFILCMTGWLLEVVILFLPWNNFKIYVTYDYISSFPSTLLVYMGNMLYFTLNKSY